MLCRDKLQSDVIRAEKMQSTARCKQSSKALKLLIIIMKHDDSEKKLKPINYDYEADLFCTRKRNLILSEDPQVRAFMVFGN